MMTNESSINPKDGIKKNVISSILIAAIFAVGISIFAYFIFFNKKSTANISIIILIIVSILITIIELKKSRVLKIVSRAITEMEKGNFVEMEEKHLNNKTEVGEISRGLNSYIRKVSKMLKEIKRDSEDIDAQAVGLTYISADMLDLTNDIVKSTEVVTDATKSQTQNISDIVDKLFQFGQYINGVNDSTKCIDDLANEIGKKSKNANQDLKELFVVIKNLNNNFNNFTQSLHMMMGDIKNVTEMTDIINNISKRTNLLALNAAIEAARAGESGMGFSIVATEIKKLAEMSQSSSNKIYSVVDNISKNILILDEKISLIDNSIVEQNEVVNKTINVFNDISKGIEFITPKVHEIVEAFDNVNNKKENILTEIEGISSMSQEIVVTTEEISNIAKELNSMGHEVTGASANLKKSINNMNEVKVA